MIKSVDKALSIMEIIQKNGGELSATEIASSLGYVVSTTHNLIRTLANRGYLEQAGDSRSYRIGPAFSRLVSGIDIEKELNQELSPVAARLSNEIDENVIIASFRNGENWNHIVNIKTNHALTVNSNCLVRPFYSYASGRLFLAYMPEKERKRVFKQNGLPGKEWVEVTSLKKLEEQVSIIREQKYAVVHDSLRGVIAIATLIKSSPLDSNLALGAVAPALRMPLKKKKTVILSLLKYSKIMEGICNDIKKQYGLQ